MKETKLKYGEISISKFMMFFAIYNECHIKGRLIMKTADLIIKYIFINIYHMLIFETSINMNFKSIKTYSDPIS